MTDAGWAEKKADSQTCPQCAEQYGMGDNGDIVHALTVARLLRQEHARSVRIIKAEMKRVKMDQHTYRSEERCLILGSMETVLNALQRGRGGKG